ncbi:putative cation-transporting ATPase 13A4, partial [Convolutriloba macropyga]|uniref:putative cation-transporting ATPase 13A4 n=1 Tax=Convolutriloba macropyga TaxID=536237 RepID=UPI003F520A2E
FHALPWTDSDRYRKLQGSKPRQSFEIDSLEARGEALLHPAPRSPLRHSLPGGGSGNSAESSCSLDASEAHETCGSPALWDIVMATCHGLTVIDSEVVGDPLDKTLFESTRWSILDNIDGVHPPGQPGMVYTVQKRYPFSSEDMRSTAVVQLPDGQRMVVCKGSPERVAEVAGCKGLPTAFADQLHRLMSQGARCVVLASGALTDGHTADLARSELEARLDLVGIAAMSAPIKAGTAPTIAALHAAGIRSFMVTGDHLATAVHTARKAGMLRPQSPVVCIEAAEGTAHGSGAHSSYPFLSMSILAPESDSGEPTPAGTDGPTSALSDIPARASQPDLLQIVAEGRAHLAVTGKALAAAQSHSAAEALTVMHESGAVFARMLPNAKASLLAAVSDTCNGTKIGFVGDGANDIMALREAHVDRLDSVVITNADLNFLCTLGSSDAGLSLCEAEASIAAPLTSKEQSPYSIVKAIAEGRAVLACSYQTVQYVVIYAYIQVQSTPLKIFLAWAPRHPRASQHIEPCCLLSPQLPRGQRPVPAL